MAESTPREIPPEILRRLSDWRYWEKVHRSVHTAVGLVGVVSGVAVGARFVAEGLASDFAFVSLCCLAVLSFLKPDVKARHYGRAVGMLESAVRRYSFQLIELKDLLRAVDEGREVIAGAEREDQPSAKQVKEALREGGKPPA